MLQQFTKNNVSCLQMSLTFNYKDEHYYVSDVVHHILYIIFERRI